MRRTCIVRNMRVSWLQRHYRQGPKDLSLVLVDTRLRKYSLEVANFAYNPFFLARCWRGALLFVPGDFDRYFCPHLGNKGYPQWVSRAAKSGSCVEIPRSRIAEAPLPPGFKVLVYGNSHLRQARFLLFCQHRASLAEIRRLLNERIQG